MTTVLPYGAVVFTVDVTNYTAGMSYTLIPATTGAATGTVAVPSGTLLNVTQGSVLAFYGSEPFTIFLNSGIYSAKFQGDYNNPYIVIANPPLQPNFTVQFLAPQFDNQVIGGYTVTINTVGGGNYIPAVVTVNNAQYLTKTQLDSPNQSLFGPAYTLAKTSTPTLQPPCDAYDCPNLFPAWMWNLGYLPLGSFVFVNMVQTGAVASYSSAQRPTIQMTPTICAAANNQAYVYPVSAELQGIYYNNDTNQCSFGLTYVTSLLYWVAASPYTA